jgi:hypothetical protein
MIHHSLVCATTVSRKLKCNLLRLQPAFDVKTLSTLADIYSNSTQYEPHCTLSLKSGSAETQVGMCRNEEELEGECHQAVTREERAVLQFIKVALRGGFLRAHSKTTCRH